MRLFFTIIYSMLVVALQAQSLKFRHLSVKDGLPHNSVLALQQDADGRIWIATMEGIVTFDGQRLSPIDTRSLPNNRAERIYRDDQDNIWVRCTGFEDRFCRYDAESKTFQTISAQTLGDAFVQKLMKGYKRHAYDPYSTRLWQLEKHTLLQTDTLHPQQRMAYTGQTAIDAGLLDNVVYTILLDNQGTLWVGSANSGLFFADTRQLSYQRIVCQPTPLVRTIYQTQAGQLYMALNDKQLTITNKELNTYQPIDYPLLDSIEGCRVRTMFEDERHYLWMGTRDGLYMRPADQQAFQRIDMSEQGDAGKATRIYALCADANWQLWIGTASGLYTISLKESKKAPVLVDSELTTIHGIACGDNGLYLATEAGLYLHANGESKQLSTDFCYALAIDPQGNVWTGTSKGLRRLRMPESSVQAATTDSIPAIGQHTVQSVVCYRDYLWCCYDEGVCCINVYTGKATFLRTEPNEYVEGSAYCDNANGRIFFGGTAGIDCFNAIDMDQRLRTSPSALWLDETTISCTEEPATKRTSHLITLLWLLPAMTLLMAIVAVRHRKKERLAQRPTPTTPNPTPTTQNQTSPFITQATRIMEAHLTDTAFSAEQFAQEMAMSRTKLFTMMKAETGKTVFEFVRDTRLSRATELLLKGMPVADIITKCGFSDTSNFRRSFVKKFGMTPSEYRAQKQ